MHDEFFDRSMIPRSIENWHKYIVTDNISSISLNSNYTGQEIKAVANNLIVIFSQTGTLAQHAENGI